MKLKLFLLPGLFLLCTAAFGQVPANSGIDPAGNPANLPATDSRSSNYNPNAPGTPLGSNAQSREVWAEQWGAIAGDGTGFFGIVTDVGTKEAAKSEAVAECRKRGGNGCTADTVFVNQCAAVVMGSERVRVTNAPTVEEAIAMGDKSCRAINQGECRVYWSGCSLPKRIQ